MIIAKSSRTFALIVYFLCICPCSRLLSQEVQTLRYAPAPIDNPLKGFVPYQGDGKALFPHSLEFNYLPFASLVKGEDQFDWSEMDSLLNDIASRGHQAIFRVYIEYPGKKSSIPSFLVEGGLKVTRWEYENKQGSMIETPDYSDLRFRRLLTRFIEELGRRYDGDPRIGFITAGLLGLWGEWHTHPRSDLFAEKAVQRYVMDAYEKAFKKTPVLLRYPANEQDSKMAGNADRALGYHDDSFAWATLRTGRQADSWFYMALLEQAGEKALLKWKTYPIGGEIRPEAWGIVFDTELKDSRLQDIERCVSETHVTWLMDSGLFGKKQSVDRIRRAEDIARKMGYEFYARSVSIQRTSEKKVQIELFLENRGVAPFYADWPAEWGLLRDGKPVAVFACSGKLKGLLPGEALAPWQDELELKGVPSGLYEWGLRVSNPLPNGRPIRFANETQDEETGWLKLGEWQNP
jgi:hypothetical protein